MDGQFQPRDTPHARELRNAATPAERTLWRCLSGRKIDGWKFSRQMPVGPYFADFLCREAQLIVELDGYSHDMRQAHDEHRDHWLAQNGFRVLRFTNSDVMANVEGVVSEIERTLALLPTPNPSRKREGDI
ncbi:endonuclease domain-containing protein [Sphingopyxis sp.]|uniref:endonuclease domain-containing protein n=1 Tax=Sphingopyxis sp. TaxID=1908224 RepID=UPI002FCA14F9